MRLIELLLFPCYLTLSITVENSTITPVFITLNSTFTCSEFLSGSSVTIKSNTSARGSYFSMVYNTWSFISLAVLSIASPNNLP